MTRHEYDHWKSSYSHQQSKLGYLFLKESLLSNQTDRYGSNGNATYKLQFVQNLLLCCHSLNLLFLFPSQGFQKSCYCPLPFQLFPLRFWFSRIINWYSRSWILLRLLHSLIFITNWSTCMDTMVGLEIMTLKPTEEPNISVENLAESITTPESEHAKQGSCWILNASWINVNHHQGSKCANWHEPTGIGKTTNSVVDISQM